ncbi:hypothetical protein BV898_16486 [Hypsibius exemplaris]|uniref:Uncharacterized protein n=1 Tax=Hypsibius exemplaris TaxID=2072580 RepID=A0A9X6NDR6_HYPEX|nr:hypothetical protein BV898_16486 [Hypsibius exemplaris]
MWLARVGQAYKWRCDDSQPAPGRLAPPPSKARLLPPPMIRRAKSVSPRPPKQTPKRTSSVEQPARRRDSDLLQPPPCSHSPPPPYHTLQFLVGPQAIMMTKLSDVPDNNNDRDDGATQQSPDPDEGNKLAGTGATPGERAVETTSSDVCRKSS